MVLGVVAAGSSGGRGGGRGGRSGNGSEYRLFIVVSQKSRLSLGDGLQSESVRPDLGTTGLVRPVLGICWTASFSPSQSWPPHGLDGLFPSLLLVGFPVQRREAESVVDVSRVKYRSFTPLLCLFFFPIVRS